MAGHSYRINAVRVGSRIPHVRFEPTPRELIPLILEMAGVDERDLVYDLGSGDGRIVIAAARDYGARGVGIEINARLIDRARENARATGMHGRVRFVHESLYETDVSPATVVVLYLLPEANLVLRPKLLRELRPGTRIVSHTHDMKEWRPQKSRLVTDRQGWYHRIHLWTVPGRPQPLAGAHSPETT
jgi:SAM-dependent methyltransferase